VSRAQSFRVLRHYEYDGYRRFSKESSMRRILPWSLPAILFLGCAHAALAQSAEAMHRREARITREVRHKLIMLPQFSVFDNLAFKVEGDTVTLFGQVTNAVLKDEAQSAIKRIEGVEHIDNQIEILPPSPHDDRIRRQVARAIFRDDRLFRYSLGAVPSIHIIVKSGHVALEGVVANQGDKNVAGIRANGVPGVFSVANNLSVERSATK
jgi:hyperosmotically inducible periplasmic protein